MASHDSLADIWQYLLAAGSSMAVFVGSHIKTRDRVARTEERVKYLARKEQLVDDTHTTVIRLEEKVGGLEDDIRASGELLARDLRAQKASQTKIEGQLEKIGRMFKIDE